MTLRGPADADHYRVAVGRYGDRWYVDPLPACPIAPASDGQWPSVTTVKKGGNGKDWSFVALKRVAEWLAKPPPANAAAALAGLSHGELYDRLKSINQRGLEQAGTRGTQVHTMFELGLRGRPMDIFSPDQPGAEYLPAVQAFFDQYQPELVAAEVVAINRNLNGVGYGGTGDAIIRIDGKTYWPDWKSRGEDSSHGAYPEEGAQVGAYALADYLIVEDANGPTRIPVPELDGGLIVSVKPDGCRIYPVDLKPAGEFWTELHRFWCARQHEREAIGKPWAPRKVAAPTHTARVVEPAKASTGETGVASPVDRRLSEVMAQLEQADRRWALLQRYQDLCDDDRARFKRLLDGRSDDLDAVEAALDKVDPFAQQEQSEGCPNRPSTTAPAALDDMAFLPLLPTPTDEGGPVDDATFEVLERQFYDLPDERRMWLHNVILEADQAGVPFRANKSVGRRTVRRFELYRGLLTLATADIAEDELVRMVLATVWDSNLPFERDLTLGHHIGCCGVEHATQFARLCVEVVRFPELTDLRSRPATA